jgi:hypothetical protein
VRADPASTPTVRSSQLAQVDEVLARQEPAVVTISGAAGIGKSTFLDAVADRAVARGWHVVGDGRRGTKVLAATGETTIVELASAITGDLEPSTAMQSAGESARVAGGGESRSPSTPSTTASFLPPIERAAAALEEQSRPVALLFDGYRPPPEVDRELASLVERARSREVTVVVVACDAEPEKTALGSHADLELVLEPFGADELRTYFEKVTAGVEPPLSEEELKAYVRAARTRPDLVNSLTRLFAFIATGTPIVESR